MAKVLHVTIKDNEYIGRFVPTEKEHYLGKDWRRLDQACTLFLVRKKGASRGFNSYR